MSEYDTSNSFISAYDNPREDKDCNVNDTPGSTDSTELSSLSTAVFDYIPQAILVLDRSGSTVLVNPAFKKRWVPEDKSANTMSFMDMDIVKRLGIRDVFMSVLEGAICEQQEFTYNPAEEGKTGPIKVYRVSAYPIRTSQEVSHVVFLEEDITREREAEDKAYRLSFYDVLTGLPNRSLLLDRLSQRLAFIQRYPRKDVLVLLNLDRFKVINDARGNQLGDSLLTAVATRLQSIMREADTVARMSADEFALLLPSDDSNSEQIGLTTMIITERIRDALRSPFLIEDESFVVTASFGVTLLPITDDDTPQLALKRADTALHRAKDAGGNQYAFFDPEMGETASENYRVERELADAIRDGQLRLFLQPQVDSAGSIVAAEALVRWEHPSRGLLSPAAFIPIAEQSDLIIEVGKWVLTQACGIIAGCDKAGQMVHISVNMSPRHFRKANFTLWVKNLLERSGAKPNCLTLEITEGLFIGDMADIVAKMNELVDLGISFSLDDFGTGYSSLAYLKRLPIHELKIDKSFVQDAPTDTNDAALVEAILAVASLLKLRVVAEGVETHLQAEFLNARAHVLHQGYLYGKPESAEKIIERWKM